MANRAVPLAGGQHQGHPQPGLAAESSWAKGAGTAKQPLCISIGWRGQRWMEPFLRVKGVLTNLERLQLSCVHSSSGLVRSCKPHLCSFLWAGFHMHGFAGCRLTSQCLLPGWSTIKISKMPCLVCGVEQEAAWAARSHCAAEAVCGWFHRKEAEPHSPCGEQLAAPSPAQTRPLPSRGKGLSHTDKLGSKQDTRWAWLEAAELQEPENCTTDNTQPPRTWCKYSRVSSPRLRGYCSRKGKTFFNRECGTLMANSSHQLGDHSKWKGKW